MIEKPEDAQFQYRTNYFKVGLHGVVFIWLDSGWIRSTMPRRDLENREGVVRYRKVNEDN